MQMRHVIPAVKIVIDKYFPVTVDVICLTAKVVQLAQSERSYALHQSAKKF